MIIKGKGYTVDVLHQMERAEYSCDPFRYYSKQRQDRLKAFLINAVSDAKRYSKRNRVCYAMMLTAFGL